MTLSASNVSLTINQRMLLDDISLQLETGQVLALCGPNGAGKTSLLRTLSSEWSAYSGDVVLDQQALDRWPARERAMRLAVLPQHSGLDFAFNVEEVVGLGRTPHSSGAERDTNIINAALAAVNALALRERIYPQLSGGEKQRVQLARVFAQIWPSDDGSPRYLLLDEPAAALDLAHQKLLHDAIKHLAAHGVGVLVVVHDLNLAAQLADHILLLNQGRIVARGTPVEVMQPTILNPVFGIDCQVIKHPLNGHPVVIL